MKKYFCYGLWLLILAGCGDNTSKVPESEKVVVEEEELARSKVNLKIERLDRELAAISKPEDAVTFLDKHPEFVNQYLEVPNAAKDPAFVQQFYDLYSNPTFKAFEADNAKYFGDFSEQKSQMEEMFSYVKYYYPSYPIPTINTVVTGFRFNQDFSFSDSLIVISIDYFMGSKGKFRPQFYDYMLARYDKPYIVPMMGLAVSTRFNEYNTKDETMLAEIIHYGKAHYFLERIMPGLPDSLNIQYSGQELKDVEENADIIWKHFIEKKLLFDTNHKTIQKYVGESPKVVSIGDKCPGRIGRWLGWQIVRKYMKENPDVTLQQLMKNSNAQEIFKKSKFKISS